MLDPRCHSRVAGIQRENLQQAPSFGDHQVLVKVGQAMEAFQLLENEPENYLKILIKLSN